MSFSRLCFAMMLQISIHRCDAKRFFLGGSCAKISTWLDLKVRLKSYLQMFQFRKLHVAYTEKSNQWKKKVSQKPSYHKHASGTTIAGLKAHIFQRIVRCRSLTVLKPGFIYIYNRALEYVNRGQQHEG